MYKGSFQLKKQGSRYQTVVDQQVVMKFHMNTQGSYNVYGKGVNAIGEFNLMGTMVMSGKTGGQVELYRMYPPARLTNPAAPKSTPAAAVATASSTTKISLPVPHAAPHAIPSSSLPGPPPMGSLARRESTRLVKLPSRLEDDDPSAQLSRIMEKCADSQVRTRGMSSSVRSSVSRYCGAWNTDMLPDCERGMDRQTVHRGSGRDQ
jgi:hypothetical protein